MRFAAPAYLLLLWGVLALAGLRLLAGLRRRRRARSFAAAPLYRALTPDLGGSRRAVRDALRLAAAAALVLALARPQFGQRLAVLSREGVDVIVAVDTSSSMLAEDLRPNRLQVAKRAVIRLSERLRGDRLGIVVFAGSAFIQCPLTLDAKAARMMIEAIGPEVVPDPGTSLVDAIDRATAAFASPEKRFKALVLFTDGEETAGSDPLAAARRAAEAGVKIFTIGLGAVRGEPIPVRNPAGRVIGYKRDKKGEVVVSRLDEATLKEIARIGDGDYFAATPAASEIDQLFDAIDNMEKREIQGGFHAHYEDRFHWFAILAFICLAAARLIGERSRPARAARGLSPVAFTAWVGAMIGLALAPRLWAADPRAAASEVRGGNQALARGDAGAAAEHYLKALEADPERPEIQYNLGNALYEGGQWSDAVAAYGASAGRADSALGDSLRYNLGNALFRQEKYAEAAEAYKQVLRQNPADEAARWNLELALKRRAEQKQKEEQQPKPDSSDQKPQQENQPSDNSTPDPTQDQRQKQNQSQNQNPRPGQAGEEPPDAAPKPDSPSDPDAPPKPSPAGSGEEPGGPPPTGPPLGGMSREEAARLLEALGIDEQKLLEERFRARGRRVDVEKDW
jgi:Ca-activated chloride channel family protein